MTKKYNVPEEVRQIWSDYYALLELRDEYVIKSKGFKKAKKVAKEAIRKRDSFFPLTVSALFQFPKRGLRYKYWISRITRGKNPFAFPVMRERGQTPTGW